MKPKTGTLDGNQAVAAVAYRLNEVIAIYPITPSSAMGEWADEWAADGLKNIWDTVPLVQEMQSEGGAAGAVHGALQTGALTTTFTASQGLLLMIPNMFKIAGELTATVFHVAARSLAAQGLSIFGDHSDVMATRATGFAMLCSNSVQEAMDFALIAQAAALESRVPFLHFFDGFRTSHEVAKVEMLDDEVLRKIVSAEHISAHRRRGLSPDRPTLRGTAQNPDVYFQARETVNRFYAAVPGIVQKTMDALGDLTGRAYALYEYYGTPDASRLIVMMGSGAETAQETVDALNAAGEKVGLLKVRLYRPFGTEQFLAALPETVERIAVLDRTKEPGAGGEPLYLDVVTAISEGRAEEGAAFLDKVQVVGGRYGLSSKEFTPAMVKGVFDNLKAVRPKNHFTIGIRDDVTHISLEYDPEFSTEDPGTVRAIFFGLGADGTVGANKNSVKIIGEETDNYAQGYFVYDSKKSGSVTESHLRFGKRPIHATYLIQQANFVACHQFSFLERIDVLKAAEPGSVFLLNSPYGPEEVWEHLPRSVQTQIIAKDLHFYVVDGHAVAQAAGMGGRINTILQACFFAISGVLPREEAIARIKEAIKKSYGKRGAEVLEANYAAVDMALDHLFEVNVPKQATGKLETRPPVPQAAPEFVRDVLGPMIAREGDSLPVSALPVDGVYPTDTAQWEKRNIALEIPVWDSETCIQCGKCVFVCPHAVIREKVYAPDLLAGAPDGFKSAAARWKEFPDQLYTLQVSPEDCTGCALCIEACPVKSKTETGLRAINMAEQPPLREQEAVNWEFFLSLPEVDRAALSHANVKNSQLLQPLFEFSGACAACGETPYLKLLSQLFGDRTVIANATGCSSIYGGNLPTTPWAQNAAGRGPAWANSLFEDNAEFGLGMRLSLNKQAEQARELVVRLRDEIGAKLADELLNANQGDEVGIQAQRVRVTALTRKLAKLKTLEARRLEDLADALVEKTVWIVGGDGWAYDIGYGGLDHVLASGQNVNILVLDTEVYSNTGGQASKSTPRAAAAKFAANGKDSAKKDLGMIAMSYKDVYVAKIAMGASDTQTLKAFLEAQSYPGVSLIIAYSHCIAHGIEMRNGLTQQRLAVESGYWPLYRFDPRRAVQGQNPLQLDSREPSIGLDEYAYNETRYKMLLQSQPARAEELMAAAQEDVLKTWSLYKQLATLTVDGYSAKSNGNGEGPN
ncbi:MAG: pyruvate:ferredoxin (flavodoxin) oxidoreductase [Chloroflexi bacterium]|nr:pyruvate:ferredoxin (flavodoxin) oxidoreductase [Chloroflexota bacterium]